MPTLILFRHAKSSWDDPSLEDRERPLNRRGAKDAPAMAQWIATRGLTPDLVLCSTALRTRATLALALPLLASAPKRILHEDELYLAGADTLIARVHSIASDTPCAMMVGHNPGMHEAAVALIGRGPKRLVAQIGAKFPTAAVAVLELPAWADAGPGAAELTAYMCPKLLA